MTKGRFLLFAALCGSLSCVAEDSPDESFGAQLDASVADVIPSDTLSEPPDFGCGDDETVAPIKLECTGLYSDWATKTFAPGVREFTPSTPFWSDGAEKRRWVYLPPGTTIDASNRSEWVFPIGTKFWKEFRVGGRRIETRIFKKLRADRWVSAAYAWSKDETSTTFSMGGDQSDVDLGGGVPYHIATAKECSDCHKGRRDSILGFEEISLGGPNATGLTLSKLVGEKLLVPPPPSVDVRLPDDGTGMSSPALGWIHVNCGVTCHNRNSTATGNGTKMFLRLDVESFGTKPPSEWDVLQSTLRATTITPAWLGETRVVPGRPDRSLLVRLISSRGAEQMPPISTHLVDQKNVELVKAWIASMPVDPPDAGPDVSDDARPDVAVPPDVGPPDAEPPDVSTDTGTPPPDVVEPPDAGAPDAVADVPSPETGSPEAGPDAGAPDAAPPDAGSDDVDAGPPDGDNSADGNTDVGNDDVLAPDASDSDPGNVDADTPDTNGD